MRLSELASMPRFSIVDVSLAMTNRLVEAARRLGDRRRQAIAHWLRAQDYWRSGRFAEGRADARQGRQAYDAGRSRDDLIADPAVLNRTVEAYCGCMLGEVDAALRELRAMAEECRGGNPLATERVLTVLGVTQQLLGNVDETRAIVQWMDALPKIDRQPRHADHWPCCAHWP